MSLWHWNKSIHLKMMILFQRYTFSCLTISFKDYYLAYFMCIGHRTWILVHLSNSLKPIVRPSVCSSVRQSHFWARRALALRRKLKEAPRRKAELSSKFDNPCQMQFLKLQLIKYLCFGIFVWLVNSSEFTSHQTLIGKLSGIKWLHIWVKM